MKKLKNEELGRLSVEDYKQSLKSHAVIVLDDIRSMHNVGSAFRTADAFRVSKVYLCGITAQPPHREIQKTALGATESVDWEYCKNVDDALKRLKSDYRIVCVEQADEALSLQSFKPVPEEHYAFVFGNEVFGVNETAMNHADYCLEIPQFGTKHSLNVSVSVGVVLWDYFMKMGSANPFD